MTAAAPRLAVRPARPDDADGLAQVFAATWESTYRGILPPAAFEEFIDERGAAYWRNALNLPPENWLYFVAVDEADDPIGLATAGPDRFGEAKWAEIGALYVMPGYQRRGLGRQLLCASFLALDRLEFAACIIWALEGVGNRGFYERLGGKALHRRISNEWGHDVAQIGYVWHDLEAPQPGAGPRAARPSTRSRA